VKAGTLWVTGDPAADRLCNTDPLALMLAMLLDQQISIELAFKGPSRLRDRLDGDLGAASICAIAPPDFAAIVGQKPALHRFPKSMAGRIQDMCQHLVDRYDGEAEALWRRRRNAEVVHQRLLDVPGFGDEKAKIFLAVLAKRFGFRPAGWETIAFPFGDDQPRSVADMGSEHERTLVRDWKKSMKAAGKYKTG